MKPTFYQNQTFDERTNFKLMYQLPNATVNNKELLFYVMYLYSHLAKTRFQERANKFSSEDFSFSLHSTLPVRITSGDLDVVSTREPFAGQSSTVRCTLGVRSQTWPCSGELTLTNCATGGLKPPLAEQFFHLQNKDNI